jgi:hypothetical protein
MKHQISTFIHTFYGHILAAGFSLWEYWLGKTKKFAANSSWELLFSIISWLLKRGKKMGYSKEIKLGSIGALTIAEDKGVASVKISLSEAAGGGALKDVVKATVSAELDVSAEQLIIAGLELAKLKYPTAAPFIEGVEKIVSAELAKI